LESAQAGLKPKMNDLTRVKKTMQVLLDQGSGRSFVVVFDDPNYLSLAQAVARAIADRARVVVIQSASVSGDSWRGLADDFAAELAELKIRQGSFVGLAAGATLVQNLALDNPKIVRTLVVVDASLRAHPSRFERMLDAVESRLPFGLPLRLGSKSFNIRAYAHRLRCPLLLVSTQRASSFISKELHDLGLVAPTAWFVEIAAAAGRDEEAGELADLVLTFHDTPAKCPQKNLKEAV
jgi:pimeloyl-ACP methyl ester carboxylesterase